MAPLALSSSKRRLLKSASSLGSGTLQEDNQVEWSTKSSAASALVDAPPQGCSSFHYDFDPTTGLPIFDIDDCSDDELLGGEVSPLVSLTRDEELRGIYYLRSQLSLKEKAELTDPRMLIRHFRAEKGNATKALETLRDALQWRRDFEANALRVCMTNSSSKVKGSKDYEAMMRLENATGKIFVRGTTLEGRALMYMFAMRNNTHCDMDNMRHLVWNLEKAIRVTFSKSQGRLDKYCLLIDCANYNLSKAPSMHASKMTLDVLQKHFKERMHRVYILNPPLAFRIFWKLVQPFVDPVTKTKLVFCSPGSPGVEQLYREVGPEQAKRLEECAFGTEPIREFNSKEYLELPMEVGFDE